MFLHFISIFFPSFNGLQKMNSNQALATVALLIFLAVHFTDAARYVPKWKKQACEVPASQNEQSHYTCDDNGELKCLPGKLNKIVIYLAIKN